jgi:23S rRNA G2445 N2-methylase RlmL
MKVTVKASNGHELVIWRERDTFFARRAKEACEAQVCLAVDLFEVIAELAELDLERAGQAAEAVALSEDAQRRTQPRDAVGAHDQGSDADGSVADDRRDAS